MEKLYVVECNSGQYEDYRTWISGIYDNLKDAEERKKEILNDMEVLMNNPEPFEVDYTITENYLTPAQWEQYSKWQSDYFEAQEFNGCEITEYNLNEKVERYTQQNQPLKQ